MENQGTTVVFELAGQRFGLPARDVREVLLCVAVAPLPRAPAIVEGIINVRGALVPVLDIRARFGFAPKAIEPADRLIVASVDGRSIALRVDGATDLIDIADDDIENPKHAVPESEYVAGVAKLADGLVLIHDLRTFLSLAEAKALDRSLRKADAGIAVP